MPLFDVELNRLADSIVASDLTAWLFSGAIDMSDLTTNRIGTASATLTAARWTNASSGDVTYQDAVAFGVLDAAALQTVRRVLLRRGNALVSDHAMAADVPVAANGTFTLNAQSLVINGSTT